MSEVVKYFYKGNEVDLIIYVTSEKAAKEYLKDPAPSKLADVVEVFKVFTNADGKGNEGTLGEASHAQLENEFGKHKKIEEIIDLILKEGKPNGNQGSLASNYYKGQA
ncbi:hypothetical protein RNJ44_04041 [Nakaseomyces bracarensis]|uniref:Ribosome maturation protein SDO1/SBDS N-terminal domain-containing protein n=1 Tax=Nakaseomyces bracarensis TaxID=273131 RepID=A0ABR4NTS1_9SACH